MGETAMGTSETRWVMRESMFEIMTGMPCAIFLLGYIQPLLLQKVIEVATAAYIVILENNKFMYKYILYC